MMSRLMLNIQQAAWRNRFQSSMEVSDVQFADINGGVQQMVPSMAPWVESPAHVDESPRSLQVGGDFDAGTPSG